MLTRENCGRKNSRLACSVESCTTISTALMRLVEILIVNKSKAFYRCKIFHSHLGIVKCWVNKYLSYNSIGKHDNTRSWCLNLRIYVQRLKNALKTKGRPLTPITMWMRQEIHTWRGEKCVRYQCFNTQQSGKRVEKLLQSIIVDWKHISDFLSEKDSTKWTWSIYDCQRFIIANHFSGIFLQYAIYRVHWKRSNNLAIYCF